MDDPYLKNIQSVDTSQMKYLVTVTCDKSNHI